MDIGRLPNIYISESRYKMIFTETSKTIVSNLYAVIWMRVNYEKASIIQIVDLSSVSVAGHVKKRIFNVRMFNMKQLCHNYPEKSSALGWP